MRYKDGLTLLMYVTLAAIVPTYLAWTSGKLYDHLLAVIAVALFVGLLSYGAHNFDYFDAKRDVLHSES